MSCHGLTNTHKLKQWPMQLTIPAAAQTIRLQWNIISNGSVCIMYLIHKQLKDTNVVHRKRSEKLFANSTLEQLDELR